MTKPEAERQLERVKFLRELATFDRERADRLDERATELEIEALGDLCEGEHGDHGEHDES